MILFHCKDVDALKVGVKGTNKLGIPGWVSYVGFSILSNSKIVQVTWKEPSYSVATYPFDSIAEKPDFFYFDEGGSEKKVSKQYYEAHVTMFGDREWLETVTKSLHWKFSAIDGDPNLGDGVKLYATIQLPKRIGEEAAIKTLHTVALVLEKTGAKILRKKIELVLFDERTVKFKCNGACPECIQEDRETWW